MANRFAALMQPYQPQYIDFPLSPQAGRLEGGQDLTVKMAEAQTAMAKNTELQNARRRADEFRQMMAEARASGGDLGAVALEYADTGPAQAWQDMRTSQDEMQAGQAKVARIDALFQSGQADMGSFLGMVDENIRKTAHAMYAAGMKQDAYELVRNAAAAGPKKQVDFFKGMKNLADLYTAMVAERNGADVSYEEFAEQVADVVGDARDPLTPGQFHAVKITAAQAAKEKAEKGEGAKPQWHERRNPDTGERERFSTSTGNPQQITAVHALGSDISPVEAVKTLRAEVTKDPVFTDLAKVRGAYTRVLGAKEGPAGDISMVFAFMRMLDPGSVVRESEYALAAQAGGLRNQMIAWLGAQLGKGGLSPAMRAAFKDQALILYKMSDAMANDKREWYAQRAADWKVGTLHVLDPPDRYLAGLTDVVMGPGEGKKSVQQLLGLIKQTTGNMTPDQMAAATKRGNEALAAEGEKRNQPIQPRVRE